MTNNQHLNCNCCDHAKNDLQPVMTNFIGPQRVLMCQRCIDEKHIPRWLIILASRMKMTDELKTLLRKHRYCGDIINVEEVF